MLLEFAHRTEESTSFSGFGSSFRLDFSGISSLLILKRKSSFKVCYLVELEFGLGGRNPRNFTQDSQGVVEDGLYLTSKEISHGGRIPRKFTQDSQGAVKDISPPLEWYGVPEGTQSLVVIMEDPDVPEPENPIGVPWVHWVLVNIPPTLKGLPAGFTTKEVDSDHDDEFGEIQEGVNDFKVPGYKGPNPPAGLHHYSIKLYALDTKLKVSRKPSRDKVLDAMSGHILDEAELIATYGKENHPTGHHEGDAPYGAFSGHSEGKGGGKGGGNTMGQLHR
ncbi:unnamed protein product [Sphagnum troendelagicum]